MDILDNVMYATYFSPLTGGRIIESDYVPNVLPFPFPVLCNPGPALTVPIFNYSVLNKLNFCISEDISVIERGVLRHWHDVNQRSTYLGPVATLPQPQYSTFQFSSTYHLIYAYLIENTRILQIFERVIEKYLNDEELGIADRFETFSWIQNSEKLFYKSDTPKATNLRSFIRPSSDASRRNAYNRMFGMDLAFGDIDSKNNTVPFVKAKASNQQFIAVFERYMSEIWQGFINARNTSGSNSADVNILVELAQQLREMLIARRGDVGTNSYARLNLSKEEYSSVLMSSWFTFIVSYNSPLVNYLNCQSSTIGERLLKIGARAGIPAHTKCQSLFEMAASAATILLAVEAGGLLDDPIWMQQMLVSLNPGGIMTPLRAIQRNYMNDFLTVINNWEKATGHKIKNPEANITGSVRIQQQGANGVKAQTAMN